MKHIITYCLTLTIFISVKAQTFTDELDKLISNGMLSAAEYRVDSVLMSNPGNADALLYKGNIQYYKYASFTDPATISGIPEESVYTSDYTYIGQYLEIVPKEIADTIAFFFVNALKVDPKRDDIRLALCYIYSISLQADKVIGQLPFIVKIPSIDAISIRDYAYNLIDRGAYEDGLKVYESICALFPEDGNLLSDLAVENYINGAIINSMNAALNALKQQNLDTISYSNSFFIFGVMEEYDLAIKSIDAWSELMGNHVNLFYTALVKMYKNESDAKVTMQKFIDSESDITNEKKMAKFLLSVNFDIAPEKFDTIFSFGLTDAFNIIIAHYFNNKYPDAFAPAYNYAESLTYNKRYQEANRVYSKTNLNAVNIMDAQEYHFYYAWSLYKTGNYTAANEHWQQAALSNIAYISSGANYFLGKYYAQLGDYINARKYFLIGANTPMETKFSSFCSDYLSSTR